MSLELDDLELDYMKRYHLFEFNDQTWLPALFRDFLTDILQYHLVNGKVYQPALPLIKDILQKTGHQTIIDLCSGASGPWLSLANQLIADDGTAINVFLTDKYPSLTLEQVIEKRSHQNLSVIKTSVDILNIPPELKGVRTVFSSFHHLKPEQAKQVLRNVVAQNAPICVFEFTERTLFKVISMLVFSPLVAWIITVQIRPFTLQRFFWTFVVPVVPLIYWWDGVVSYLRTYTVEELREFTSELGDEYVWQVHTIKTAEGLTSLSYLTGHSVVPKNWV